MVRTYCFSCGAEMEPIEGQPLPVCSACRAEHGDGEVQYLIRRGGGRPEGPLTEAQILEQLRKGLLDREDRIAVQGREWMRLDHHPDFSGLFVAEDPRAKEMQQERDEARSAVSSRKRRETLASFGKVAAALVVLAVPVGLYFSDVQLVDPGTISALQEGGEDALSDATQTVRKAIDEDVARQELEAERGLPGQDLVEELAAQWPDARGGVVERISLARLGLLQGTESGWENARRELEYAVAAAPENVDALALLAVVYSELRSEDASYNDKSIDLYNRASALDDSSSAVAEAQAGMAHMSGAWDEAEKRAKACLAVDPEAGLCLWYLGSAQSRTGRFQEAEQTLSRAKEVLGDAPVVDLALGQAALETFQYGAAREPLRTFAERYPDDPGIHALLARFHRETGDFDASLESALRAVELDGGRVDTRLLASRLYLQVAGNPKLAWSVIEPALALERYDSREEHLHLLLAGCQAALAMGDHPRALELATELSEMHPGWAPAELSLAKAHLGLGDAASAEEALKLVDITSLSGRDLARYHLEAARYYQDVDRGRLAHFELESAAAADPTWPTGAMALAQSFLDLDNPGKALDQVESTWRMDDSVDRYRDPLELIIAEELDLNRLSRDLQSSVPPGDRQYARLEAALAAIEAQGCLSSGTSCDRARLRFAEAIKRDDSQTMAHAYMGRLLMAKGDHVQGLQHLERALANEQVQPLLLALAGIAQARQGEAAASGQSFNLAHKHGLGVSGIHRHHATALLLLGQRDEAIELLHAAVESDPHDIEVRRMLLDLEGEDG
jgi:tetratricopeptide (TPR) repeat protein